MAGLGDDGYEPYEGGSDPHRRTEMAGREAAPDERDDRFGRLDGRMPDRAGRVGEAAPFSAGRFFRAEFSGFFRRVSSELRADSDPDDRVWGRERAVLESDAAAVV